MKKKIENLDKPKSEYTISDKMKERVKEIYDEFTLMRKVQQKPYKYFNDRSLTQFIDDSEKRFNSYVPTRASQNKEDWQSNFFHPVTKNKTLAILAAVALSIPRIKIAAVNEKKETNVTVANIIADLVKDSYNTENKEEENFFEALDAAVKGTVISYDGYLKTKVKQRIITAYDVITGEVTYEEKEVIIDEGYKDFIVPLENFFVYSAYIRDVQKQPAVIWVQYMSKRTFAYEFSNYVNYKYVRTKEELVEKDIQQRFFYEDWNTRTKEDPIEVIRYYNKINDEYVIIANGVLMLDAPLLLGRKKKVYPFSKSGYSPFASDFFWMNSLPNMLTGEQDIINSFYAMTTDKTYKSLVNNLLIGNTNKDDFDLADEELSLDSKIYVQDINQVREMPNSGVTASEFNMIKLISQGLDLTSVDAAQQGVQGNGVTAREVIIANENARRLKGIFFLFITSFWLQKIKIRVLNILTYITSAKLDVLEGVQKGKQFKKFIISGTELTDGNKGNKGIIVANKKEDLPTQAEIAQNVEEYKAINKGVNYEEVAVTASYLNDWEYKIKIITDDLYQEEGSYSISKNEDKLKMILAAFPDMFQKNEKKLFKDTLNSFNEDVDEYDLGENTQPEGQTPPNAPENIPTTANTPQNNEVAPNNLPPLNT